MEKDYKRFLTKCHTGQYMIHTCLSDYHDNSHLKFLGTKEGMLEHALFEASEEIERLREKIKETSHQVLSTKETK